MNQSTANAFYNMTEDKSWSGNRELVGKLWKDSHYNLAYTVADLAEYWDSGFFAACSGVRRRELPLLAAMIVGFWMNEDCGHIPKE